MLASPFRFCHSFVIRHSSFSVHPLAAVGSENRQFFHHELSFANGANHVGAGGGEPFFRHFFPGMAAPALGIGMTGENTTRSEEHTSELQSRGHLVCRLLLEKKKKKNIIIYT